MKINLAAGKWDWWVRLVTLGQVDLVDMRLVEYVKGYRKGRHDEANAWWREQDEEKNDE